MGTYSMRRTVKTPVRCKVVKAVKLTLPMPPSVNHYWLHIVIKGQARVATSADAKRFRTEVYAAVLGSGSPRVEGRLEVRIVIRHKANFAFDLDNFAKSALDAIMHAHVFEDDSQIDRLVLERGSKCPPEGRIEVEIRQIASDVPLFEE